MKVDLNDIQNPWVKHPWRAPLRGGQDEYNEPACAHRQCPRCKGTGRDERGNACIHFISCPCPKCSPMMYSGRTTQRAMYEH